MNSSTKQNKSTIQVTTVGMKSTIQVTTLV
jgi:hypothetical protein